MPLPHLASPLVLFSSACAIPALIVGAFTGKPELLTSAPLGSVLSAMVLWRWLMTGREERRLRAILVGILTSMVAHLVTWLLIVLAGIMEFQFLPHWRHPSLWEIKKILSHLGSAFFMTGISLILFGLFTIPAGGLIGFLAALYAKRLNRNSAFSAQQEKPIR